MAIQTVSAHPTKVPGGGYDIYELIGLSTDPKPTTKIGDDSTFEELDTGNIYRFSTVNTNPTTGTGWWPL